MATDLKKWGQFSAILEDPRMRSSRKVVIGDVMDRKIMIVIGEKSWLGAKNIAKVGKRSQKGGFWNLVLALFFFNIVQSIQFIYTFVGSTLYWLVIKKKSFLLPTLFFEKYETFCGFKKIELLKLFFRQINCFFKN